MAQTVGRNVAAPLLFLNLIMYLIVVGFASWCLNRFINGQTNHPSFGGNGATMFFLIFSILAGVMGIASKLAGANHIRAWRSDSLAAAGSSAIVAWALTGPWINRMIIVVFVNRLACKQISIGGFRGWRLRLLYLWLLHVGVFSSKYGPGYRDTDYPAAGDPIHKGTTGGVPASRVV
ncbi:unnamed protein product [Malus baccata var. baccata]